jgi:ApbE superfamily uncharacterized protein (UPF0280 family)
MSEFVFAKLEIEETAATIAAERQFVEFAVDAIKVARLDIERQIRRDDFFMTTLEPYELRSGSPRVLARMCDAARAAGVGPMAAVAGGIAQEALEAMVAHGCSHGWVDNGGDIALVLEHPVTVEIFSNPGSRSAIGLELEPSNGIIGVCTSSGRLGHSISFGDADAAVAIAKNTYLADALATAIGNLVKDRSSMDTCFDDFRNLSDFVGGLVLRDGDVVMYGKLPRIVNIEHNPERITAHSKMSSSKYVGGIDMHSEEVEG